MSFKGTVASVLGDIWISTRHVALWPFPLVAIGERKSKITWDDYRFFTSVIQPGDFLLLTTKQFFISNAAISGTAFKHLAVYTGPVVGNRAEGGTILRPKSIGLDHKHTGRLFRRGVFERSVTHAVSEGVVTEDFGNVLFHADWACIVRAWQTPEQQIKIVETALKVSGFPYDFDFENDDKPAYYCTEVGAKCCAEAECHVPFKTQKNVSFNPFAEKREVFMADAFALTLPIIATSVSCANPKFGRDSNWPFVLRGKLNQAPDAQRD